MVSTRTNRVTNMADGLTQARAADPAKAREQEINALKLNPRQRDLLARTLASYPQLTVAEAHEMMREAGM